MRGISAQETGSSELSLISTREAETADWIPDGVPTVVLPWQRRTVQLLWVLGHGPQLEEGTGPLDVVHLTQQFPPVKTLAPQIVTIHDLFPVEHPDWYRRSERWTYRRSMELLRERAARIVVPTAWVAERVVSLLGVAREQVQAVPLGVTGLFAELRSPEEIEVACSRFGVEPGSFAVSVGQVSTRKNVISIVRAAAQLSDRALPLVLIGPDAHGVEQVEAEIARLGSSARIIRTGFLPDADTAALVQAATVLVHPALGEGFGFVPLEAMAAGTPVIAARSSSIPEVVGDAAILVDEPTQADAWAEAIGDLLGRDEERRELIFAGQRRSADFTWTRTARTMLDIYAEIARA